MQHLSDSHPFRHILTTPMDQMALDFFLVLPSGKRMELSLPKENSTVADMRAAAKETLGHNFFKLATSDARLLKDSEALATTVLQDGDSVMAILQEQPRIVATSQSFALWYRGADEVVTWGDPSHCDVSMVNHQLKDVKEITASHSAYAALLGDGSVVTWGEPKGGGDSEAVKDQLHNVKEIAYTSGAFAALREDGSVVSWGNVQCGSDSRCVQDQLYDVRLLKGAGSSCFSAIRLDGKLVTWSNPIISMDPSEKLEGCEDTLKQAEQMFSTTHGFCALLPHGRVICWGMDHWGTMDDINRLGHTNSLYDIEEIHSTIFSFVARRADGECFVWGGQGRETLEVQHELKNVKKVAVTSEAFAALKEDGSVFTWGVASGGGDSSSVQDQLTNVKEIHGTHRAFAAIKEDGSVVTWGQKECGGDSSHVQGQLQHVLHIAGTQYDIGCLSPGAFAAILEDGNVITWGLVTGGGDSSAVEAQLRRMWRASGLGAVACSQIQNGSFQLPTMAAGEIAWTLYKPGSCKWKWSKCIPMCE